MNASLGLMLELGVERIEAHLQRLHQPVLAWAERTGTRRWPRRAERTARASCASPRRASARRSAALKAARIICSLREGAIRLSPHGYNTVEEMERVAAVLEGGQPV